MILLLGMVPGDGEATHPANRRERLGSMLQRINREGRGLMSPYRVTGDIETNPGRDEIEFQAVYKKPEDLFDHIWLVLYELHPAEVFFSIGLSGTAGLGEEQDRDIVAGPVLRRTLAVMDRLTQEGHLIGVSGLPASEERLANYSLALISDTVKKWKKRRFAILYALSRSREVGEVAEFLEISERSVYKNIRAGSLETILGTVTEIAGRIGAAHRATAIPPG